MNITLKTILCVTALIHCTQSLEGAITLNEGETFTYEFNDLPFLDFNPFDPPSASWQMDLPPLSSESSVMFKMEMFENSTTEPPVASMIFDATTLGGRNNAALGYVPNVWQDLQGAVTLTMLSGSSDFSRIYLNVTLDGDYGNWPNHYTSFELNPVPEPSTISLAAFSLLLAGLWKYQRSRNQSQPDDKAQKS